MIENGSDLLYRAASTLEKALVDVDAKRLSSVPAQYIRENIDPWKVQSRNLPHLAWSLGVTLWESYWTEDWKRQWLANQGNFKAHVGTLRAIRMALEPSGYEIKDVVRPPAGFYASPDLSAEEMDAWVRLMPQIRIKFVRKTGQAFESEWFSDAGIVDDSFVGLDDGSVLWGRVGVLRSADGSETPLDIVTENTTNEYGQRITFERYAIPRNDDLGFFADADAEGEDRFALSDDGQRYIYSARLEASHDRAVTTLSLTPLNVGLTPLTPRYERDSDVMIDGSPYTIAINQYLELPDDESAFLTPDDQVLGVSMPEETDLDPWSSIFAEDAVAGVDYLTEDLSAEMLADRVYLLDPRVTGPMNAGVSFVEVDRVGMPIKTAEILVDLHQFDPAPSFYEDEALVGEAFATPEDSSHVDRALRAANAGKALSHTVLASFEAYKPVSFGSIVQESTKAGDWLPALL